MTDPASHAVAAASMRSVLIFVSACAIALSARGADPAAPEMSAPSLALSSPLVIAGEPFNITLIAPGSGGAPREATRVRLEAGEGLSLEELGPAASETRTREQSAQGVATSVVWEGLVANSKRDWILSCTLPEGRAEVRFHVFDAAPATSARHETQAAVPVILDSPIAAEAANGASRLSFVLEDGGDGYAIAEAWDGGRWRRSGSLYPLCRAILEVDGRPELCQTRFSRLRAEKGELTLDLQCVPPKGTPLPARLVFRPDATRPILFMEHALGAVDATELMAFTGPNLLAGDRSFGSLSTHIAFPGCVAPDEAFHGDITPSADRITTPLMAVEGRNMVAALLWPGVEPWAGRDNAGAPAARLAAAAGMAGADFVLLALSVPPVNTKAPFSMRRGDHVRIHSCLVLDHARRHAAEGAPVASLVEQTEAYWHSLFDAPQQKASAP